jgi:hypothetical protein
MEAVNDKHVKCYIKAKDYVRNELKVGEFEMTDQKIEHYCHDYNDKFKKVKPALKDHSTKMKQMDLYRIQSLPISKMDICNQI